MIHRRDHQVTVGIWVQVNDYKSAPSAVDDQVPVVVLFFPQRIAEYTPIFLVMPFYVGSPPGGGHSFHKVILAENA